MGEFTVMAVMNPAPSSGPSTNSALQQSEDALHAMQDQGKLDIRGRSKLYQAIFILLCCSAQLLAQAQFGMVLVPLDEIGRWLGTTDAGELSWMVASYGWVRSSESVGRRLMSQADGWDVSDTFRATGGSVVSHSSLETD